jgi:hypothetical protein
MTTVSKSQISMVGSHLIIKLQVTTPLKSKQNLKERFYYHMTCIVYKQLMENDIIKVIRASLVLNIESLSCISHIPL